MAHSSVWSVELVLRASERCLAPSGPSLLTASLRARAHSECQRLLTVENHARVAAHLSDLVAAFGVIRLAMTVAEDSESLAGKIHQLDGVLAPKLDRESVTIETANITKMS